jgi:hypothetical protein
LDTEAVNVGISVGNGNPASTATAQREIAIRVFYSDTVTGKKYHFTIPGPEVAEYPAQGTDVIDLAGTNMAALVVLLEADCVSDVGNAIEVNSAKFVGRHN